jgi:hypothetical protein
MYGPLLISVKGVDCATVRAVTKSWTSKPRRTSGQTYWVADGFECRAGQPGPVTVRCTNGSRERIVFAMD